MKIAFIGTGLMGYPMAKNLINKKLNLKVFSRTLEKAKPLEKIGAIIANSLGEAVKDADIVITMLTDDEAVEKVLSDQEFLNNLKNSSTVIIYGLNIVAGFAGADYTFTHGEIFIIWILMAILVNNCLKK